MMQCYLFLAEQNATVEGKLGVPNAPACPVNHNDSTHTHTHTHSLVTDTLAKISIFHIDECRRFFLNKGKYKYIHSNMIFYKKCI